MSELEKIILMFKKKKMKFFNILMPLNIIDNQLKNMEKSNDASFFTSDPFTATNYAGAVFSKITLEIKVKNMIPH